jgi:hypothetical protein
MIGHTNGHGEDPGRHARGAPPPRVGCGIGHGSGPHGWGRLRRPETGATHNRNANHVRALGTPYRRQVRGRWRWRRVGRSTPRSSQREWSWALPCLRRWHTPAQRGGRAGPWPGPATASPWCVGDDSRGAAGPRDSTGGSPGDRLLSQLSVAPWHPSGRHSARQPASARLRVDT